MGLKQKERSGWWRKLFQKIDAELSVFQWQSIMANFRGPMETSGEARYPQEWNNVSFAIERFHIVKIRFKSKIEITFYLKSIHCFKIGWHEQYAPHTHTHTHQCIDENVGFSYSVQIRAHIGKGESYEISSMLIFPIKDIPLWYCTNVVCCGFDDFLSVDTR